MWKGRFQEEPSARLQRFGESVSFDWRLFRQDIRGSIAHARALKNAAILTGEEFQLIANGLEQIGREIGEGTFVFRQELEDVHMNIEAELTRRIGPAGAKLHTARSRNDQVATDIRLYLRDAAGDILREIRGLQLALVQLGEKAGDILLPGYTHLQRAQPVPVAHHLLAYVEMLDRDHGRIRDAVRRMNKCPLGSGAIAGSTIVLDREAVAAELDFDSPTNNSMDAVADRDFACEILAALAITGMHLSRLGEDVILWCSTEFGYLRLSDAHTTGSSLMPQKKNPDIAELTRGKTGRLYGNLFSLLTTLKGLPLTYNRDMQEDKEPIFDSLDTVLDCLGIFAEMMQGASFREERMAQAVEDNLLLATDVADVLVLRGVPFRQAHEMVGQLVAEAEKMGIPLGKLPPEIVGKIAPSAVEGYEEIFDPARAMRARNATGAPGPGQVRAQIDRWRSTLSPEPAPE
jgi:argininosuccinate lyase